MTDTPENDRIRLLTDPRFRVEPPDLLEARWSVWDAAEHFTIGFGNSREQAISRAIVNQALRILDRHRHI